MNIKNAKGYGTLPVDLGLVDLNPIEMMFWLYCPIKLPGHTDCVYPENLKQFDPLVRKALVDCFREKQDKYVYLTVKTLWTTPDNPGNRPGWHSDGFLTDDINYIWSDCNGTVFFDGRGKLFDFTADHKLSLPEMDSLCESDSSAHKIFPNKHLLKLDESVLHKCNLNIQPGLRTFVKISVSKNRYRLKGNSINHNLPTNWDYKERSSSRNCPIGNK